MRKLLNRPALALAAVLAFIFVIVLIKSYCKLVDELTISLSQIEKREPKTTSGIEEFQISPIIKSTTSEIIGPQLSKYSNLSNPAKNTPITLGYF